MSVETDGHAQLDDNLPLWRVIIASWVAAGRVMPQAFDLSPSDRANGNFLSVVHGERKTPEGAYQDRHDAIKSRCDANGRAFHAPAGVLKVAVGEVRAVVVATHDGKRSGNLDVVDDGGLNGLPTDHCSVDFNKVPPDEKGLRLAVAKVLLQKAENNGWQLEAVPG